MIRPLFVFLALFVLITACKKNNSASAPSAKEPPITGAPSDAPVQLTPAWKPGNRYVMRLERSQSSLVPFGGPRRARGTNSTPFETTYAQEYALTITNGPAGTRGAELEILGIELQVSSGDQQFVNYDSQNKAAPRDPNNPMLGALDTLIGGKIHYEFAADNTVTKVEGVKELFARLDSQAGGAGGGRRGAGFANGILRQAMNDEVFKQMVDLSGAPPSAVKIGGSWPMHREVNVPIVGKVSIDVTNTLRGWQEHDNVKCARVEYTGTLGHPGGAVNGPAGLHISIDDGVTSGHYWYDPEIGMSRDMASEQKYKVSGSVPTGRDTNAAPQTFSAPVQETISVKLLEVKPAGQG